MLLFLFLVSLATGAEPNPPVWPSSVYIFDPSSPAKTQAIIDKAFQENGGHNPPFNGQFSTSRYAFLFKPGTHTVDVNVGFYTSVIGLGRTPDETFIQKLICENGDFNYEGGALDNFWREASNFATGHPALWAVSQAAPLRRIIVKGDLALSQYNQGCCAGYASGGFLADSVVTGQIASGSQQQWFTRNTNMDKWSGAVWNMVFVGNNGGVPKNHCSDSNGQPMTVIEKTPVIAEKPYIIVDDNGKWSLRVPRVEVNKVGPTTNWDNVDQYDFGKVFVARETDSADLINSKLASGLHLILTPGHYNLSQSIKVTNHNTTILGIGFPTLTPSSGTPVIEVGAVDGVRVSGILFQAGKVLSPTLIKWGEKGSGKKTNPGFMHDVFGRVGGMNDPDVFQVSVDVMIQIESNYVVVDNTWLWRADHDYRGIVVKGQNPSRNGMVVNGNDVSAYSLAVEHHLQDNVVWNGERGSTYFYQCELPYDVTQQEFGNAVGYRVNPSVKSHLGYGMGIYSFFRDFDVFAKDGISAPTSSSVSFVHSFTKFLNGKGGINHVINGIGAQVNSSSQLSYVC